MNEGKKDRRDPIRTIKTKNPVAKAHQNIGTGSGVHKDKKKAVKQGEVKHKGKEIAESIEGEWVIIPKGSYNDDEFYSYDPKTMELKANWSNKGRSGYFHEKNAEENGWMIKKGSNFNYSDEKLKYFKRSTPLVNFKKNENLSYEEELKIKLKESSDELAKQFMSIAKGSGHNSILRKGPQLEKPATIPQSSISNATPLSPEEKLELEAALKRLESRFDPDYEYSDDYSFWSRQKAIKDKIHRIKKQLAQDQGVAEYQDRMAGVGMGNYVVDKGSAEESVNYGWTHESLANRLFDHENTYEDRLQNLLNKKLDK